MSSRRFHLQPLLDLAQTRTDEAARKLGELIASERTVEEKLKLLEDYRQEYHDRFMQAVREGIGPDAWRNFSAFINRLDDAIAAQRKVVEQSRQQTAQGQQFWLTQRNRLKAFDTLSQRHQASVARSEAKQEQKLTDEHAARRSRDDTE
ncbi:MAG: flagellar export protein FliJ [Betaproteobacteria bacterium]|nr:MAG: flagellar export protein FliJ [Betaproteobacteria bacterium]